MLDLRLSKLLQDASLDDVTFLKEYLRVIQEFFNEYGIKSYVIVKNIDLGRLFVNDILKCSENPKDCVLHYKYNDCAISLYLTQDISLDLYTPIVQVVKGLLNYAYMFKTTSNGTPNTNFSLDADSKVISQLDEDIELIRNLISNQVVVYSASDDIPKKLQFCIINSLTNEVVYTTGNEYIALTSNKISCKFKNYEIYYNSEDLALNFISPYDLALLDGNILTKLLQRDEEYNQLKKSVKGKLLIDWHNNGFLLNLIPVDSYDTKALTNLGVAIIVLVLGICFRGLNMSTVNVHIILSIHSLIVLGLGFVLFGSLSDILNTLEEKYSSAFLSDSEIIKEEIENLNKGKSWF